MTFHFECYRAPLKLYRPIDKTIIYIVLILIICGTILTFITDQVAAKLIDQFKNRDVRGAFTSSIELLMHRDH